MRYRRHVNLKLLSIMFIHNKNKSLIMKEEKQHHYLDLALVQLWYECIEAFTNSVHGRRLMNEKEARFTRGSPNRQCGTCVDRVKRVGQYNKKYKSNEWPLKQACELLTNQTLSQINEGRKLANLNESSSMQKFYGSMSAQIERADSIGE